ncbi:MAG: type II toxin-antitoxin system RelB/DinJ family antitoxin [Rhodospirillaceae bacterium]|nr:type II toxin-antitoxin system RelB/DinJ family antitoxin [Rhodospirillaceae bacterium]MDE0616498.1 type II toxin-antitoxin system RelB/DinJ family antitoxin [Rhodospirillaceae bacterium]MXY41459.1 type II toxin-antitoxin system RelB/DinJ family antitoxin [Rhodospirillaceae bacterium]MYF08724.1 type II toxin-antitoxin system RelB/DinJ family antitoxin [Rhodospirillaceae bacterium]MYF87058.1 type II toxin-antitoxin system RelB/DinJ family antitoxin [Rhodospirillaceae bacterium]
MAKTDTIRARVEPGLKHDAEAVFSMLGLTATEAIRLFYKQVTLQNGLPFAVKIPNAESREALRQAEERENLTEYGSLEDLKAAHD